MSAKATSMRHQHKHDSTKRNPRTPRVQVSRAQERTLRKKTSKCRTAWCSSREPPSPSRRSHSSSLAVVYRPRHAVTAAPSTKRRQLWLHRVGDHVRPVTIRSHGPPCSAVPLVRHGPARRGCPGRLRSTVGMSRTKNTQSKNSSNGRNRQ